MSGYFALKLEIRFWTVSSLPQPPMGYVHSLMLAPVLAALAAAEEAVEEAAVLLEEEPPQAASAPAAPRIAGNAVFHGRFSLFIFFDPQWIVLRFARSGCSCPQPLFVA